MRYTSFQIKVFGNLDGLPGAINTAGVNTRPMSGQPPVMPPTLSYKSKAEREKEERERREREEAERLQREQQEAALHEAQRKLREQAAREVAAFAPPVEPEPPASTVPPAPAAPPTPLAEDVVEGEFEEEPAAPSDLGLFEEGSLRLTYDERQIIQPLEVAEMVAGEGDVAPEEEEEEEPGPPRHPPRPPKSPDMRPVYAGFLLVFVGLAQLIYGIWSMTQTPSVGTGPWAPMAKWGHFSMAFTAAVLGTLAIRGGMWSFRKERFSVVKIGAISATVCVWALWVPWLFGLLALLMVSKARDEYYPFYDPRWDGPSWVKPPPSLDEEEEEGEGEDEPSDEEELDWEDTTPETSGDALSG
jgi:hypothetical protein